MYNNWKLDPNNFILNLKEGKTRLFNIGNNNGLKSSITNYGGIIISIMVPDKKGVLRNVVIGFNNIKDVIKYSNEYYIGAAIGPVAGRIKNGRFNIGDKDYQLMQNCGCNTLHSGINGFHSVLWDVKRINDNELELIYCKKDGDSGFPGNLIVKMNYILTDNNDFVIKYEASSDKDTIFNSTNHSYFNLSGKGSTIDNHKVRINADYYLPIDSNTNNTGEILKVKNTPFDFLDWHSIGERINTNDEQIKNGHGYDHCFIINRKAENVLTHAASCMSPFSGITMDVYTTEPGLIVYSGNYLPNLKAMNNESYPNRGAICFETEHFPDTPNNMHFPSILLKKNIVYKSMSVYHFSTEYE